MKLVGDWKRVTRRAGLAGVFVGAVLPMVGGDYKYAVVGLVIGAGYTFHAAYQRGEISIDFEQ